MTDLATILRTYLGSDGDATKALYVELERRGPAGHVAVNLFRACKASERAKVYRGGGYRGMAYDRKEWALGNLAVALSEHASRLGIIWGWGIDTALQERGDPHHHVLYVELPTGQVSFHTGRRGGGPDYLKPWDGMRGQGATRICSWCHKLLSEQQESVT